MSPQLRAGCCTAAQLCSTFGKSSPCGKLSLTDHNIRPARGIIYPQPIPTASLEVRCLGGLGIPL